MSKFDRWSSWFPRSFAHQRFKEHHTEINDLYWALAPAAGYTDYLARHAPVHIKTDELFHATGPNARRIASSLDQWRTNFAEFRNWVRLSSLLSALSYLESYISTVSTLALRSDPLLRFGQTKTVDGTAWLKRSVSDDVSSWILPIVKGEWPARTRAYRNLFAFVPHELDDNMASLEQMRQLRNGVAHSFGRDSSFFEDPMVHAGQSTRLSEDRLLRWLSIIESCADAIDDHLFRSHIGEFELLWRYHRWQRERRDPLDSGYTVSAAFSRTVIRSYGSGPGRVFCKDLIKHYEQL